MRVLLLGGGFRGNFALLVFALRVVMIATALREKARKKKRWSPLSRVKAVAPYHGAIFSDADVGTLVKLDDIGHPREVVCVLFQELQVR